jgi:uncharacterized protein YjiS (DUF1127 family)
MIRVHEALARREGSRALRPARGMEAVIAAWLARSRYRRELRRLLVTGRYLIDDVGLSVKEAVEEAHKPFWRD